MVWHEGARAHLVAHDVDVDRVAADADADLHRGAREVPADRLEVGGRHVEGAGEGPDLDVGHAAREADGLVGGGADDVRAGDARPGGDRELHVPQLGRGDAGAHGRVDEGLGQLEAHEEVEVVGARHDRGRVDAAGHPGVDGAVAQHRQDLLGRRVGADALDLDGRCARRSGADGEGTDDERHAHQGTDGDASSVHDVPLAELR